jgi:tetratricopeptide (TPR) repeat protein
MTLRQSAFAVTVLVLGALIQTPAFAGPGSSAGRKHAAKANQLAAQNRCKAAVAEFTKAYRLLKDPALLFNRAECYRKIGKDRQAVRDYERFLAEMPHAPNQSTVEARIASLRGGAQAAEPSRKESHAQPGAGRAPPGDTHADKWGASDVMPLGEEGQAPAAGSAAIGTAAPGASEPQTAANLTTQPIVPEPKQASRSHAWIWIGTAVVVVGAGAFAAYRYWPRPKTDVPQTPLGNHAF